MSVEGLAPCLVDPGIETKALKPHPGRVSTPAQRCRGRAKGAELFQVAQPNIALTNCTTAILYRTNYKGGFLGRKPYWRSRPAI
jgi:hypothetical protein